MAYNMFLSSIEELIERAERGDFGEDEEAMLDEALNMTAERTSYSSVPIAPTRPPPPRDITPLRAHDSAIPDGVTLEQSSFRVWRGCQEHLLQLAVLPYLTSRDIGRLSGACKYFHHLCNRPTLWEALFKRDFVPFGAGNLRGSGLAGPAAPAAAVTSAVALSSTSSSISPGRTDTRGAASTMADPRGVYVSRFREYHNRLLRSKDEAKQLERDMRRSILAGKMERVLDWTQLRLPGPIILSSLFLSITLYCQKVDGLDIPFWACAVPLAFSCLYVLGLFYTIALVHDREYSPTSICKGFWTHLRGPFVLFYQVVLGERSRYLYGAAALVLLLLVQIGLFVVKLSLYLPASFRHDLSWGMVFIPSWIYFLLFPLTQCTSLGLDPPLFVVVLLTVWVPFVILFVCLAIKLDYNNNGKGHIRMAYVFIPFFIVEGVLLVWSALAYVVALLRYRRGYLDRTTDHTILLLLTWGTLAPLVSFQALVCARDDANLHNHHSSLSATEMVSPLLVLLGWVIIVVTVISGVHKTAFENRRANTLAESAGLRVIHTF